MASNTIIKGVHVSFDIVDHFTPRIPKQRCPEEDATISRICVAENLTMAINALPQAGDVICAMKELKLPIIIHAYYIKGEGMNNEEVRKYVPDAEFSGEYWITSAPSSVLRIDYEITGFETKVIQDRFGHDLIILWEIHTKRCKFQDNINNFLKMYGKNGDFSDVIRRYYKSAEGILITDLAERKTYRAKEDGEKIILGEEVRETEEN